MQSCMVTDTLWRTRSD